jgi:hypothetical protein
MRLTSNLAILAEPNNPTTNSLSFWLTARRHGLAGNGPYCGKAALSSGFIPNWTNAVTRTQAMSSRARCSLCTIISTGPRTTVAIRWRGRGVRRGRIRHRRGGNAGTPRLVPGRAGPSRLLRGAPPPASPSCHPRRKLARNADNCRPLRRTNDENPRDLALLWPRRRCVTPARAAQHSLLFQ